jgi:glycosyltransferase involved in cell wall biosynthesis
LIELLAFDGIAAVSDDSRQSLLDYWRWLGIGTHPPVQAIPLGTSAQSPPAVGDSSPPGSRPILLSIGSFEGRKNHLALLEACELLWRQGEHFELHLIGLANPKTGRDALARIPALQAAGRRLRYDGPVSDANVDAAYAACTFSVYPSLMEGFGLPVIESLAHGKPCICSAHGALGESAAGGGCIVLDNMDAVSLAHAIGGLLHAPARVAALAAEARTRRFKSWSEYTSQLIAWLRDLPVDGRAVR